MPKLEVRTQIYLEKAQHEALKQYAAVKDSSMAQIIREAVALYLVEIENEAGEFDSEAYENDPIWTIPEVAKQLGPSGFKDASVNHDHYLYGFVKVEDGNE